MSVYTRMARLGIPPHVADRALNHESGTISGVAAVYNRFQLTNIAHPIASDGAGDGAISWRGADVVYRPGSEDALVIVVFVVFVGLADVVLVVLVVGFVDVNSDTPVVAAATPQGDTATATDRRSRWGVSKLSVNQC
jgi:hypothetical protein